MPDVDAAAEGPASAASTAINAMTAEPRLPDFLFAISPSLLRNAIDLAHRSEFVLRSTLGAAQDACLPLPRESLAGFTRSSDQEVRMDVPKTRELSLAGKKERGTASQM